VRQLTRQNVIRRRLAYATERGPASSLADRADQKKRFHIVVWQLIMRNAGRRGRRRPSLKK